MEVYKKNLVKKLLLALMLAIWVIGIANVSFSQGYKARMWLLSIGISHYEMPKFRLEYADKDAIAFKQTLARNNYLPEQHTKLLLNMDATKQNIQDSFDWLQTNVSPTDIVVIFFSGHGIPTVDPEGYQVFPKGIMPYDALPFSTANDISYREFTDWIYEINAYEIVVIIDACGSGDILKSYSEKSLYYQNDYRDYIPNITYMVSCETDQISKEFSIMRHGLFTNFILEGLEEGKKADFDSGGRISASELFRYVNNQITKRHYNQDPMFISDTSGDLVFLTGFDKDRKRAPKRPISYSSSQSSSTADRRPPRRADDIWRKIYENLDSEGTAKNGMGQISVNTYPANSTVLIDNQKIGTAPLSYPLPAGRHKITIARAGYEIVEQMVNIKPNSTLYLTLQLEEE
jgi:hypothetical protein